MTLDYDTMAQEYAQHRQVHPEVLKKLMQIGAVDAASRVLDVGCGTGNYTVALHQNTGCSCWAVEPSAQMLATAKARHPKGHFSLASAEELAFPADFFDLVFSVDVIHHVHDRPAYFRQAYDVLKPGGQICTVTDSEQIIRNRQPLSVYFPETIEFELQRYARIAHLHTMMHQAGFCDMQKITVEFTYSLTNIDNYRAKAFSCLHLIPPTALQRGLQRMEEDLRAGAIRGNSRYVLVRGRK